MLDTAIIGGGLCGLMLARGLQQQGQQFALFEARERLGGRILSAPAADGRMAHDLGPTWYWPHNQPRMTQLIATLGLVSFPQYDSGTVLSLTDPARAPDRYENKQVHDDARRLAGGMASLVQALAAGLPTSALHLRHTLVALIERSGHVELHFRDGSAPVAARRVLLALPPRLLEQHVRFEPALDASLRDTMRATPTWMAAQAKVVATYQRPFWREAGLSGSAFADHSQVVLHEVFDACDAHADQAALGAFIALSPARRATFQAGLPLLIGSQLAQLFGAEADNGAQHMQDWAEQADTCSALDRSSPDAGDAAGDSSALRQPCWHDKLYFCGAETARHAPGYMEGALEASERIFQLPAFQPPTGHTSEAEIKRSSA